MGLVASVHPEAVTAFRYETLEMASAIRIVEVLVRGFVAPRMPSTSFLSLAVLAPEIFITLGSVASKHPEAITALRYETLEVASATHVIECAARWFITRHLLSVTFLSIAMLALITLSVWDSIPASVVCPSCGCSVIVARRWDDRVHIIYCTAR